MTGLIQLRGVGRTFYTGSVETHVLEDITLDIQQGEFVAIVGASGSGKSTLLNILGGLDSPTSGTYHFAGQDVGTLDRDQLAHLRGSVFGFVFQHYNLIPGLDVVRNVEVPCIYSGVSRRARRGRAVEILADIGLKDHLWKYPAQLSGGQQQRVAIARALVNGCKVILADEPTGALDSVGGMAVMEIFRRLANSGQTVIVITHDLDVAAYADRTIEIKDGRLTRDQPGRRSSKVDHIASHPELDRSEQASFWHNIWESGHSAFTSLGSNSLRTSLTLLGVVIGVASIVSLVALSRGAEIEMINRVTTIGTNWILVESDTDPRSINRALTADDAAAISRLPNVSATVPAKWGMVTVSRDNREARTELAGTVRGYRDIHRWNTRVGTYFSEQEESGAAAVALLGHSVAEKLFPDMPDPSGQTIMMDRVPFVVSGVLETKGFTDEGHNYDDRVLAPLGAVVGRVYGNSDLNSIVIALSDMEALERTKQDVRSLLIERHGKEDFWLIDTANSFRKAAESRKVMNLLIMAIASISLIVGGIGIMNMMLTTVSERTREIGIRMALGATVTNIVSQFMIEAVVLSFAGGVAGLIVGIAIGVVAALLFGMTVVFSVSVAAGALAAAFVLGSVFGLMPALKAARMNPAAALASD